MSATPRLEMRSITKRFGGVHALDAVSFQAGAGEVHSVCGENGAGKSTLMKILSGGLPADSGEILIDGTPVRFNGPRDAEARGIRMIHQELNLVPELTVAANIFLGREKRKALGILDNRAMEAASAAIFARLGTPISPRALVSSLRIGDQQMVEIAKALAFEASIVIMDEPTSALSDAEVARLFRVIQDLRASGTTVLYISHKMNEVFTLSDRVTVLRDGKHVATADREASTPGQVVRWMVGREIAAMSFDAVEKPESGPQRLVVEGLSMAAGAGHGRPSLKDISFHVAPGEVVGVAGLLGAGRTELLEAIYGASEHTPTGIMALNGRHVRFRHPREAIAAGVALVTEDRKLLGLFHEMDVARNITIGDLENMAQFGFVRGEDERLAVFESIDRLGIKTRGGGAAITSLSGGNQQKCIIARWLLTKPKLLLLDEPTRGIDVGAKAEIYALIRLLASRGMSILMTSSELPELLAVCDRIMVMCEGRITAQLPRSQATEESIMHAATAFLDRASA